MRLQLLGEGEAVTEAEAGPSSEGKIGYHLPRELDQNCSPGGALE